MTRVTRVKLFLTEYKALCEKYGLIFVEGMPSDYSNSAGVEGCKDKICGHCHSCLDLVDTKDNDIYKVTERLFEDCRADLIDMRVKVKVYNDENDKIGEVVEPYESMPELTKDFIGKAQKTDEEIREELAADGVFI